MIINRKGVTRIVFVFSKFVIKIPNFIYQHNHFLQGCYANWSERQYCKSFRNLPEFYDLVIPSHFCSWFGLIQIQARAIELDRHLTDEEWDKFKEVASNDMKKENFGYYKGRVVCLDYV